LAWFLQVIYYVHSLRRATRICVGTDSVLYIVDLIQLVESHGLSPHLYADDVQVYDTCSPAAVDAFSTKTSDCADVIADWVRSNTLMLNPDKSEAIWCTTSPGAPIAVGAQRGDMTHLPPATIRPHHRCVGDTTLAARPRTRAVQDQSANVKFCTTARHDISDLLSPSLTYLVGVLCGHQVPATWSYRPSNCLLLTAVPFWLLRLKFETVCQRPSSHLHHCSLSGVN